MHLVFKIIFVILFCNYMYVGKLLFKAALDDYGGKNAYIDTLKEDHKFPTFMYYVIYIYIVITWPVYFLVWLLKNARRK